MVKIKNSGFDFDVAIIGSGFGGLGLAVKLKESGNNNFVIFERADQVGGTWRDNIYPGCGCDIPSHLYSFSFEMNSDWSREYSLQPEILEYIINLKNKYNLEPHIQYNTNIVEARFDEENLRWLLRDQNGGTTYAKTVISAIGPLNVPNIPDFKGLDVFEGKYFHSSEWNHEVEYKDKKVIVIGTGASAIQIVPSIAAEVNSLALFQRTPAWILPKNDRKISSFSKKIFKKIPPLQKLKRLAFYWFYELVGKSLFSDNFFRTMTRRLAIKHLHKSISDPILRNKLTPDYQIGCKRRLPSDDYFPALTRANVELVTDAVQKFVPEGIIDEKGILRAADVVIFATGFHVADFEKRGLTVLGVDEQNLFESWKEKGPEAYWGTCISGYPGLLFILGPNTGLGHNSQLHIIESQFNFIMDYLKVLQGLPDNACLSLKKDAQQKFNDEIHQRLKDMVWSSGCNSWYLHKSGRNSALWPGYTATFRKRTKKIKRGDFDVLTANT